MLAALLHHVAEHGQPGLGRNDQDDPAVLVIVLTLDEAALLHPADVSVASATGIVSRMEERSLVERQHDDEDRRVVLVIPTETGLAVFRDMMEQRRQHLAQLLGRLSDEELEGFLTGMRAVRTARIAMHADAKDEGSGPSVDEAPRR